MKGLETKMEVAVKKEDDKAVEEDQKKKKKKVASSCGVGKKGSASGGGMLRCCQAEKCNADLNEAKQYHRRHKVCEFHAKAQIVLVAGMRQRFCQQCSRFHELVEFDDTKRSCRRRLAGHNERRRKNTTESQAESSSRKLVTGPYHQLKDIAWRDDKTRIQTAIQENAAYKHFQIR